MQLLIRIYELVSLNCQHEAVMYCLTYVAHLLYQYSSVHSKYSQQQRGKNGTNKSFGYLTSRWVAVIEKLLVRVHPDLSGSHCVLEKLWPGIRCFLREDMAHMGTGVNLQWASTLPNLEVTRKKKKKKLTSYHTDWYNTPLFQIWKDISKNNDSNSLYFLRLSLNQVQ